MERALLPLALALVVAATLTAAPLVSADQAPAGLRPSPPVVCRGNQDVVLERQYISTPGNGVEVRGNCSVLIVDSHIEAGGVALLVYGNGDVKVKNSFIQGALGALHARGNGEIEYQGTTVRGSVRAWGNAEVVDDGANTVSGGLSESAEAVGTGDDVSVAIGPGGVVVREGGETVTIQSGPGGVRVESGESTVLVGEDAVHVRSTDSAAEISSDWRRAGTPRFRTSETARLLAELRASEDDGRLRLDMAGDVVFDFDSARIRPDAAVELAKVAHVIRERADGQIFIVGHTDSIGSASYNQGLSEARAQSVMRWLHQREGIPAALMVARGLGAKRPIVHNTQPDGSDDPEGRARNRRVEITFAVRK